MKKFFQLSCLVSFFLVVGCARPKYTYHSVYEVEGCSIPVSRKEVSETLMKKGFLRSSEPVSFYDIYKKPEIHEKGVLSSEYFEDVSGELALTVCSSQEKSFIVTEEWKSCEKKKDCTKKDQEQIAEILKQKGCKIQAKAQHGESWKLENRQDWTDGTCSEIAKGLL